MDQRRRRDRHLALCRSSQADRTASSRLAATVTKSNPALSAFYDRVRSVADRNRQRDRPEAAQPSVSANPTGISAGVAGCLWSTCSASGAGCCSTGFRSHSPAPCFWLGVAINFTNVIGRYVFQAAIYWAEEAMVYLAIWSIFLAAIAIAYDRAHLTMDFFSARLPRMEADR